MSNPTGGDSQGSPAPRAALLLDAASQAEGSTDTAGRGGVEGAAASGSNLWEGLLAGRWSVRDPHSGGGRHGYALIRNQPGGSPDRGLSPPEATAIAHVIRGSSNKAAAYASGHTTSVHGRHLHAAMHKLGVASRAALILLASQLKHRDAPPERSVSSYVASIAMRSLHDLALPADFTAAERDIAARVASGASGAQIAAARGTSARTVANQLATMYRKTGVVSREEMVAWLCVVRHRARRD